MLNEALPAELLTIIWSFTKSKTLKKIRVVNKGHGEVATKLLFEDVYITLLPQFLRKLESIANHEHLSKHVRTLWFHSKLLEPEYVDPDTFEEAINLREPFSDWCKRYDYNPSAPGRQVSWLNHLERHDLVPGTVRVLHVNFLSFYTDQQAMIQTGEDIVLLSQALRKLPNLEELKSIILSHGMERPLSDELFCIRCLNWQKHVYNIYMCNEEHPEPILTTMQQRVLLPNPFIVADGFHDDRDRERPLHSLFAALGMAKRPLRKVSLAQVHPGFWLYPLHKEVVPLLRDAFKNVSTMMLHVDIKPDEYEYSDVCFENMAVFVQQGAPLLQVFVLELAGWVILADDPERETGEDGGYLSDCTKWPVMQDPLDISYFLNGLNLTKLRALRLFFCRFQGKSFVDFMTRHTSTLRHLHMDIARMSDRRAGDWEKGYPSRWEQALQQLAPVMMLDSLDLRWLFDDEINAMQNRLPTPKDMRFWTRAYAAGAVTYLLSRGQCPIPRFGHMRFYPNRAYALAPPTR